jgi:hypothetical protein
MRRLLPLLLAGCLGWLWPGRAEAGSDTHYQDLIVGERAAGMGGAFVALASDATGAYYNPAGIVTEGSTLLQLSMSAVKQRWKSTELADVCGTRLSSDESAFFTFPGSFGFVQQLRSRRAAHAIGLTLVVPHLDKVRQSFTSAPTTCGSVQTTLAGSQLSVDRVFWGGLTYAVKPWRYLQLGVTAGFTFRDATVAQGAVAVFSQTSPAVYPGVSFSYAEVSQWAAFVQLGAIVEPRPGLRLGLSFTSPQIRLGGRGKLDLMYGESDPSQWSSSAIRTLDGVEYAWKVPFQLALGVAHTWSSPRARRLTLAADVTLHGPVDRYEVVAHPALTTSLYANQRGWVVNANVGAELYATTRLALRLGFFTNLTSYPAQLDRMDNPHVHLFGITAGGSFASSSRSTLALAVQAQLGQGRSQASTSQVDSSGTLQTTQHLVDTHDAVLLLTFGGSVDLH